MSLNVRVVVHRVIQAIIVILLAYVLVFVILTVLPGDPISNRLRSPDSTYSEADIARILDYYGLDRPVLVQLWDSLSSSLTGQLGLSLQSGLPVEQILAEALPLTLQLAAMALVFALVLAFAIALGAQYLPPAAAEIVRSIPPLFLSIPGFLVGLLLIQLFAFQMGWFQVVRDEGLKSLILPAITLAVPVSAQIAQIFISSLDHVRGQLFVTVAVTRGLSNPQVFTRHLLKTSALPTLTIIGIAVGELLAGSVITDSIFGLRGIGSVIERAVVDRDIPVLQAVVVLAAAIYVVINLVIDLVYPLLDPRLRTARR